MGNEKHADIYGSGKNHAYFNRCEYECYENNFHRYRLCIEKV